jgi:hypothetical protein
MSPDMYTCQGQRSHACLTDVERKTRKTMIGAPALHPEHDSESLTQSIMFFARFQAVCVRAPHRHRLLDV